MQQSRFFQWGLRLGSAGVLLLLGVIISGIAAPNPLFSVLTLSGIVLCGTGVLLFGISWLQTMIQVLRSRDYKRALLLLLGAALILLPRPSPAMNAARIQKSPPPANGRRAFIVSTESGRALRRSFPGSQGLPSGPWGWATGSPAPDSPPQSTGSARRQDRPPAKSRR